MPVIEGGEVPGFYKILFEILLLYILLLNYLLYFWVILYFIFWVILYFRDFCMII